MGDGKSKLYVSIEEAGKAIFNFIGSDEYESILASIEGGERGGFMTGLAISICVLMTNANKVVGIPEEEHLKATDNMHQKPDALENTAKNPQEPDKIFEPAPYWTNPNWTAPAPTCSEEGL